MSMPSPTWYDLLGVEPDADEGTIRSAWRTAIADLDPTERRFATLSEAAAVLLDPARRSAYDAEIAANASAASASTSSASVEEPGAASVDEPVVEVRGAPETSLETTHDTPHPRDPYAVPTWVLATVGVVAAAAVILAAILVARPAPPKIVQDDVQLASGSKVTSIEQPAIAAVAAARSAVGPIVTYDYRKLDAGQKAAEAVMTDHYRTTYDKTFDKLRGPIATTQTVITAKVVGAGIVRAGDDRVQVLVLVDRSTTRKGSATPIPTQDQVTLTMKKVGGSWLVDDMNTNQIPE